MPPRKKEAQGKDGEKVSQPKKERGAKAQSGTQPKKRATKTSVSIDKDISAPALPTPALLTPALPTPAPPYPPASSLPFIEVKPPSPSPSSSPSPFPSPPHSLPSSLSHLPKVFDNFSRHKINKALTFHINDVDLCIVNALRRIITSELPNVGIEFDPYDDEKSDIRFVENTSSLHNEFLGHRISMIPVKLDVDEIEKFQKEKYNFEIKKHNTSKDKLAVTSDDIKITDEFGEEKGSVFHSKVFPRCPITGDPILILILNENNYNPEFGEKLHVQFRASIGTAQKHSRYSPVSTCAYHNVIDQDKADKARKAFVRARESERLSALTTKKKKEGGEKETEGGEEGRPGIDGGEGNNDNKNESVQKLERRFNVHDIYRHFKTNEFDEPCAFAFTIEAESRLSEKYLVHKGFDVLIQKLKQLVGEKRFMINPLEDNAFSILIKGEQHTIGNLIQAMFYNMFVRDQNPRLSFVGYYLVHPLVEEIILKVKFKEERKHEKEEVDAFFQEGVRQIQHVLRNLQSTWEKEYTD